MTLQIESGRPPGTSLMPAPRREMTRPATVSRALAVPARTPEVRARNEPLDAFARRAYASAGIGLAIAAAAAIALSCAGWRSGGPLAEYLFGLLVLGAAMFVGGGVAGSARPRSHFGGTR